MRRRTRARVRLYRFARSSGRQSFPHDAGGRRRGAGTGIQRALELPWKDQAAHYAAVARRRFDVQTSARKLAICSTNA